MPTPKADLIIHPVRLRIVTAIVGSRWTAQELATALPDIPQATLYRHLKALEQGGILTVVEEHQTRGAREKVYALPDRSTINLDENDMAGASKDDHMRYFTVFVTTLLQDFSRYLQRETLNPAVDGVGYHTFTLHLDDDELRAFAVAINRAILPFIEHTPSKARKRRLFSTVVIPSSEGDS